MIKAYKVKSDANAKKIKKVRETLHLYRKDAQKIAKFQWQLFNKTNKFDKQSKLNIKLNLSARYNQTCQYQKIQDQFVVENLSMMNASLNKEASDNEFYYLNF